MENINSLRPGTILKGEQTYRIESVLGAGGFGITYLAQTSVMFGNIPVNVRVAVKEHFVGDYCERQHDGATVVCVGTQKVRDMVERSLKDFLSEARRLSAVSAKHPNIVKVNEIIEANGTAYYVMEYLSGKSLWDYIRERGSLTEEETRGLMLPIVDASAYLHASSITHLDIKPQNIMLTDGNGTLKPVLIDFGLSKHYAEDGSPTSTVNTLACSDGYSPIEQYSGITAFSPTADVYALGATILTCLTGRIPTVSTNWPLGEPARTISALPVSEDMKEILKKSMAPAAHGRYADSRTLYRALNTPPSADTAPLSSETKVKENISPEAKVKPQTQEERLLRSGHSTPENLDLEAWLPDGRIVYFNQAEWSNLSPDDKSGLVKNGVVIIKDGERFVLSLDCTEEMTWNEAVWNYYSRMPTKEQAHAMVLQNDAVYSAICAYGGDKPSYGTNVYLPYYKGDGYWTKSEYEYSKAWFFALSTRLFDVFAKSDKCRVRTVSPLATAPISSEQDINPKNESVIEPIKPGNLGDFKLEKELNYVGIEGKSKRDTGCLILFIVWIGITLVGIITYLYTENELTEQHRREAVAYEVPAPVENFAEDPTPEDNRQEAERQEAARQEAARQEAARQESARQEGDDFWRAYRAPANLDLAVRRPDGNTYYFNQAEWSNLSLSRKSGLGKYGIVIIKNGEHFILSLDYTEPMTWSKAMRCYANQLPTKEQAEAMALQHEAVDAAIRAFGGRVPDGYYNCYWTNTEFNPSIAWVVTMHNGHVGIYNKSYTGRVRPVARVAEAAI